MKERRAPSDPQDQEQPAERRPRQLDPAKVETERPSDGSTINAGGVGGGRPAEGATITPERDVRSGRGEHRAEHASEGPEDPVLPADDATMTTKM